MATFHAEPIGMHYNEATMLTNMFSKAPQQPCAAVFVHLRVCGFSKTNVLINKWKKSVCVRALYTHVMARCSMKPTGPPIIIDPAQAFPPAPLRSSAFLLVPEKREKTRTCHRSLSSHVFMHSHLSPELLLFKHEAFSLLTTIIF